MRVRPQVNIIRITSYNVCYTKLLRIFILAAALVYGAGMAALSNRANLLLAIVGGLTLLMGVVFLPGAFHIRHSFSPVTQPEP